MVLNFLDDSFVRHAPFDFTIITILQQLIDLEHVNRLLVVILLLNLHDTVLNELHLSKLFINLDVADELFAWSRNAVMK